MAQLTLRTLLAYLDDTLEPAAARELGRKVAESDVARELIDRIKKVTRRRRLQTPDAAGADEDVSDPNTVAEYLSNTLDPADVQRFEQACLDSDVHLAEVAACHQILTVVLAEPVRVPPSARERMYRLVPPPAGSRRRRTRPALPVVGGTGNAPAAPDADDTDAALLLGMDRFGAGSTALRAGMAAAGVGIAALLAVAVYMASPGTPPAAPATAPEYVAAVPAPRPAPEPPRKADPEPEPKKTPDPTPPVAPMPPEKTPDKGKEKEKGKAPAVAPGRADRLVIGKATALNTLLAARPAADAKWVRLDPGADGAVTSNDEVLCLPGYKADVKLDTGVVVSLWGNVPELLPARLLDARVRFHAPVMKADGGGFEFDADLTLLAGRVSLAPTKGQERVRVRTAGEVFDFTLPERSEVAVELTLGYEPGAAFLRAAGPPARAEVRVAVVRGTAAVALPLRGVNHPAVAAPAALSWDGRPAVAPTAPAPLDKANPYFDKFLLGPSDQGKGVQKALTEVAARLAGPDRVQLLMTELVTEPAAPGRFFHGLVGIYGLAAAATGADDLKTLVDVLTDETRRYDRVAAATALASWLARDNGNTAALGAVLDVKVPGDGVADLVLKLLRGALNPAAPDPVELDRLVDQLSHPAVAVRELALWNLINFADPTAAQTPGLTHDVGVATGMPHDRFVKAWRARVEEIKKRPAGKKG